MTRIEALEELAAKVEAGETLWQGWSDYPALEDMHENIIKANNGSLDAAMALHDAVLPGWECGITKNAEWPNETCAYVATWGGENGFAAAHDTPARAWLLAIIRALIAQEKSNDAKCDGSCVADGCNAAADGLSDAVGVPSNEAKRILDLWFTEVDGDVRVSFQLVRALQQANGNPIGVYRALTEVAEGVG